MAGGHRGAVGRPRWRLDILVFIRARHGQVGRTQKAIEKMTDGCHRFHDSDIEVRHKDEHRGPGSGPMRQTAWR